MGACVLERKMVKSKHLKCGLFLFSVLLLPVFAADLKTMKDVYQKTSEEILQSYQQKFADLQVQYQKSLETLKANAQSQGDLRKTKAAMAEISRFQKAKSLPATQDDKEIPEIKTFQLGYVKQYTKLELEMTARLCDWTTKYEQGLDRLLKDLTKAGKIDEATMVQEEQEKAQTKLKGFTDQQAALKGSDAVDATAKQDEAKDSQTSSVASKPAEPAKDPVPSDKKVVVAINGKTKKGSNSKSSDSYYYASYKARQLTCDVTMKLMSFDVKQVPVQVKVFFIGTDESGKDLVVDRQEELVTLDRAKGWGKSYTSKEIREGVSYYYYFNNARERMGGARLKGWLVQAWVGNQLVGKDASLSPLMKYADSTDVGKTMGEMKVETDRF